MSRLIARKNALILNLKTLLAEKEVHLEVIENAYAQKEALLQEVHSLAVIHELLYQHEDLGAIDMDTALPCGMLVFYRRDDERCILTVQDDGVGLSGTISIETASTLGYELVKGLLRQLGAKAEIRRNGGTEVTTSFVAPDKTAHTAQVASHDGKSPRERYELKRNIQ